MERAYSVLSLYVLIEPISKIATGILTGMGKRGIASVFTLLGYWAVGIPLTVANVLDFEAGIFSIWLGATLSINFILLFAFLIISTSNLVDLATLARERRLAS